MSDVPSSRPRAFTRQSFLLSAALSAGAAASPWVVGTALAQVGGGGDGDVLNFALTLELLEVRFYERGLQRTRDLGAMTRAVATELRDHEGEHVRVLSRLIGRLGGTPVAEPQFDFGDAFGSEDRFLEVAQQLEELGVAAYNGAATRIADRQVLATAAAIVQVEARHAAMIGLLREEPTGSGAFDRPLEQADAVDRVEPFLAK